MNIKKDILWRVYASFIMILLLAATIVYYLFDIQQVEGDKWRAQAKEMYISYKDIPPTRGSIFSHNGDLLATSVPIYRLSLDFKVIHYYHHDTFSDYIPVLAASLSNILKNKTSDEYLKLLNKGYKDKDQYLTLSKRTNYLQIKDVKELPIFKSGRFIGGVILEEHTIRKKPYYGLLARTIGYVNENNAGVGLERSFNENLAGVKGKALYQKISGGYKPINSEYEIKPKNGLDLFTSIDINIQDIVNEALLKGLIEHQAKWGTAILLEVETGKIRAVANLKQVGDTFKENYNYAFGEKYEPGSTLKVLSAMAVIENGAFKATDSVDISGGEATFYDRTYRDSEVHKDKRITMKEGIVHSSNVYFTKTVYNSFKRHPKKYLDWFEKTHLDVPLETGILGEAVPIVLNPKSEGWNGTMLPSMSLGYSVELSPLHIAMLYNAIANDGKLMKPYIIEGVGHLGEKESKIEPVVLHKSIASKKTIKLMQEYLRGVATDGTARKELKDLTLKCSGKTGTARIAIDGSGYSTSAYNASFVGYYPSDNPKYTLIVVVNTPSKGKIYGSQVALPIFKEIAVKSYASTLYRSVDNENTNYPEVTTTKQQMDQIASEFGWDFSFTDQEYAANTMFSLTDNSTALNAISMKTTMPNLQNMGLKDALAMAENSGYIVKFKGIGRIVEQFPLAGKELHPGQIIYLRLGRK